MIWSNRATDSYVRLLHAVPNAPAVDIYANGKPVVRNLSYRNFSQYLKLPPASYNIQVYRASQIGIPVYSKSVTIPPRSIMTVAAFGLLPKIDVLIVPDPPLPKQPGKAMVRFVHLSPDTPPVDITFPNGNILFRDMTYKEISSYSPLNPGTYTIQARPTGTSNIVLTVPNIRLMGDRFYTIYAIGLSTGTPGLQVLIPLDGNSYIKV